MRFTLLFLFIITTFISTAQTEIPKREFRAAWVATVSNIDWPSKKGLDVEIQKQEFVAILEQLKENGMNAIIVQIRPAADAFYNSPYENWSRYLTGTQGVAPNPYYDPLTFMIEEAHKRCIEFHAWFNPYRALVDAGKNPNTNEHITFQHPEWFLNYGGKKYFDPGLPEVRQYFTKVVLDVVKRYDIDAVHFDDYFYPYRIAQVEFPDHNSYAKYRGNFTSKDDWRRNNVDLLIESLSKKIKKEKSYVKFGISPFGIWRNKTQDPEGSESNGFDGYGKLYADARKWAQKGWIDYLNPQIYFPFGYQVAPYDKLVDWWSNNAFGKHVYIGQGVYRAMENRQGWSNRQQIPDQIRYLRKNENVQGSVFFSSKSVTNNLAGVQDSLRINFYRYPALQPAMSWLDAVNPNVPSALTAKVVAKGVELSWKEPLVASDGDKAYGYVIYRFNRGEKIDIEQAQHILKISFSSAETSYIDNTVSANRNYIYVVTALDRLKNESQYSNAASIAVQF
jgi:uncharacterized lipoprotein YddW (UPF0748 family)